MTHPTSDTHKNVTPVQSVVLGVTVNRLGLYSVVLGICMSFISLSRRSEVLRLVTKNYFEN